MKSFSVIIGLAFILGCKTSGYIYFPPVESKFSINECGYFGNSKLTYNTLDKGNELNFIGYYAIDNYSCKSLLKVKECSEYYPSGKLKSRGSYEIGTYTQCCAAGPCEQYYNYKVGEWNYYYPNEQLHAKCEYETDIFLIRTSCEGGDSLKFNTIQSIVAFDDLGKSVQPSDELLNELNAVFLERYYYKIDPANNKRITMEIEL